MASPNGSFRFQDWNTNRFGFDSSMSTNPNYNLNFGQSPQTATIPVAFDTWQPDAELTQWGDTAMKNWGVDPAQPVSLLSKDSFLGKMGPDGWIPGWGMQGLQIGSALMGAWNGMQQLDLAKDQFAFSKQAYEQNYQNQRKLTNAALRDRQRARYASDPRGQQTSDEYMKENGV